MSRDHLLALMMYRPGLRVSEASTHARSTLSAAVAFGLFAQLLEDAGTLILEDGLHELVDGSLHIPSVAAAPDLSFSEEDFSDRAEKMGC